jgi:hypothetical protein
MSAGPANFSDLSPERQANLVKHFQSEFALSAEAARVACLELEGEEFQLHLQAAEEGYI